jgi:hypothetical protein
VGEGTYADTLETGTTVAMAGLGSGGAIRTVATRGLDDLAKYGESAVRGVRRQLGQGSSATDLGAGFVAGAALESGGEIPYVGPVAGPVLSFIAPLAVPSGAVSSALPDAGVLNTAQGALKFLDDLLVSNKNFVTGMKNLTAFSTEGAQRILADAMIRSGRNPDEIAEAYIKMKAQNPEAIPVDVDDTFRAYLRAIGNKLPTVMGRSREVLDTRAGGQAGRLASNIDSSVGVPGLSVDDEIVRLQSATAAPIREAYQAARNTAIGRNEQGGAFSVFSPSMQRLMGDSKTSLGKARKKADQFVRDAVAIGNTVTHFDIIDETKKALDDMIGSAIRRGQMNRARSLIEQKKELVGQADKAYPDYAMARQLHADKALLEGAADAGLNYAKLKPRDVRNYLNTMGEAEQRMFRLGVKDALIERINDTELSANAIRKIFRTNSEVSKLRTLFGEGPDAQKAFDQFMQKMKLESEFIITRRAALSNSTTPMQLETGSSIDDAFNFVSAAMGSPLGAANVLTKLFGGWANKGNAKAQDEAYKLVGDILLHADYPPQRLQNMLRAGADQALHEALIGTVFKNQPRVIQAVKGMSLAEMANYFSNRAAVESEAVELQSQLPN